MKPNNIQSGKFREIRKNKKGDEIFIAGAGPSLLNFDFDKCKDNPILCLNGSFEIVKNLTYHICFDRRFIKNYQDFYNNLNGCYIFCASKLLKVIPQKDHDKINFYTYKNYNINKFMEICLKDQYDYMDFLYGPSILCFGLQLCIWLGYDKINLIGIDYDYTNGRCCQYHDTAHGKFAPTTAWLNKFVKYLKKYNINVYNMTKDSKLNIFPFKL